MKLYKSILCSALAAVAVTFASCSDEGKWDAYNAEAESYSFAQASNSYSVSATEIPTEIKVQVYRSTTKGSVSLPVTVSANTETLSAPSTVSFADGSNVADYVFTVGASPAVGVKHTAKATIAEENVSASGNASVTVSLVVNYTWSDWATGTITENFYGFEANLKVMKADGARAYRIMEPYKEILMSDGYSEAQWAKYSCPYIEFSVVEGTAITFNTFLVDTYDGTNMIYGYLPSELASSVAGYDAYSYLLDSKTVQIAPYYYVPGVGGWGVYPLTFTLDGSFEF